jgi:hypothetical protein
VADSAVATASGFARENRRARIVTPYEIGSATIYLFRNAVGRTAYVRGPNADASKP